MNGATTNSFPRVRFSLTPAGVVCLCLGAWGCLAIYNATFHLASAFHFVGRQVVWLVPGTIALLITSGQGPEAYRRGAPVIGGITYALLWLVLLFGIRVNGMRGWFAWHGIFLQPSELAKPAFVLALALLFERTRAHAGSWTRGYAPLLALVVVWVAPIVLQPDFGAVLVYVFTFAAMYWGAGGRTKHLAISGLAAVPLVILALQQNPYVQRRVLAFFRPEAYAHTSGWHILQFQRTLASGGLTGRSWGHGLWSQAYLPLGYSDSIFASTAEAIGFLGVVPIVLAILAWVVYGVCRARLATGVFTRAVVIGMVAMLAGQAFIHLSVTLGLLPPTGVTLPLVSYGGSSLLSSLAGVGIVEGVFRAPHEFSPGVH